MNIPDRILCYLRETAVTNPVPSFLLKKELLKQTPAACDTDALHQSKWYRQLAGEQREDGSWGRFHSMDSSTANRQKFVTTEAALRRAREIGLGKEDPLVKKSITLMERYLADEETWPDSVEKHHDNGKSHLRSRSFLTAANLCLFDPQNPAITWIYDTCLKQLEKSSVDGRIDPEIWQQSNLDYTGTCCYPYMVYPLWLIQNAVHLPDTLQRQYLKYIWNRKQGIYYISTFAPSAKMNLEEKGFTVWLSSLEVLSGFSLFPEFVKGEIVNHLLTEAARLLDADVKLPPSHPISGHYSESWRDKNSRKIDMLIRIARILIKC